jgi:hypothetical protein
VIVLNVRDLTAISAATRGQLVSRSEAASIIMWRFHAAPRTTGQWEQDALSSFLEDPVEVEILWDEPSRSTVESHRNELKNVERAAEAVAIALADHLGFKVLGETHHGSGSDWRMVPKGEPANDFYKLEVSGIIRTKSESPEGRLREKAAQGRSGDLQRPGVAVEVRFGDVRIRSEAWR